MMRFLILLTSIWILTACSIPTPLVERIKEVGELVVITRDSPTTYYESKDGLKGVEYELVELFAAELGVKVKYLIPESFDQILPMIVHGDAHFAAAGLSATEKRRLLVKFTPAYQEITQQLVYRSGSKRPKKIADTLQGTLEVIAGSSHEEELNRLKQTQQDLMWVAQKGIEIKDLLQLVKEQIIDYTIADSNEVALNRRFHPELKPAFNLTKSESLAWAFPHAEDSSLYKAAESFIKKIKANGVLEQILDRYYGHIEKLDFVGTRAFRRHMVQRLPQLQSYFHAAAQEIGLEWQLLAAIGYQESHWDPKAVSPTGVKGIMMLTKPTAKQMKVKDRTDPQQSIMGGARYIKLVKDKIPKRVTEPDQLWLALAGYNVGFGHLEDARILTQRSGGNPDKWIDIKKHLPLLSEKKHYETLKYGFARGKEPVHYVENVRSYYDLLMWQEENAEVELTEPKKIHHHPPSRFNLGLESPSTARQKKE